MPQLPTSKPKTKEQRDWTRPRYSRSHAEVMMCLLDAFCAIEARHYEKPDPKDTLVEKLCMMRGEDGSFALRHRLERVAPAVDKLWASMSEDFKELVVFDWEFCEYVVLYGIDWQTARDDYVELFYDAKERIVAQHALFERFANGEAA